LSEQAASRDDWTGRYEDLRRRVLEEAGRLPRASGIAVFVRQGLAGWMQAWPEQAPCHLPEPAIHEPARLPAGLYEEVTQLLVEMIFHHRQETRA
jgi:hypothetical protein